MAAGYATKFIDDSLRGLLSHTEVSDDLRINPKAIRPCVAQMLKTGFEKGGIPDRSSASSILASEFTKLGFERERIEHQLLKWNKLNRPPLKSSAIYSTIKTAKRNKYNYSCRHDFLREFCIGHELCVYSKGLSKNNTINFRLFFTYHWQEILKNKSLLVYWVGLPELEKRKGLKPGSIVYENQAEIARFSGISKKYVKSALEELTAYGLIEYKPGVPRKWEGKATGVRRLFPILKPPKKAVLKVTNDAP
jgi:hypothetical protein